MKHSWPGRSVVMLVGGSVAWGLLPAFARAEDAPQPEPVQKQVRRLGESGDGHLISNRKSLKKSPHPYSAASFSNRAHQEWVRSKLDALRGAQPPGDSSLSASPSAPAPAAKPAPTPAATPPNAAPAPAPAPAAEAVKPRPPIKHAVFPSGLDSEQVAGINAERRKIMAIGRKALPDKLGKEDITQLRDSLNTAAALVFSPQKQPNGSTLGLFVYGVNIVMRPEAVQKFDDDNLTSAEAQAVVRDYCRLLYLRVALDNSGLPDYNRAAGQVEYNELLTRHFALQNKPPKR